MAATRVATIKGPNRRLIFHASGLLSPSCEHPRSLRSWRMAFKIEYQCCYCGEAISEADRSALRINLSGICAGEHGAMQDMFSH